MFSDFINPNFSRSCRGLEAKIVQAPVISSKADMGEQRITKLQMDETPIDK